MRTGNLLYKNIVGYLFLPLSLSLSHTFSFLTLSIHVSKARSIMFPKPYYFCMYLNFTKLNQIGFFSVSLPYNFLCIRLYADDTYLL